MTRPGEEIRAKAAEAAANYAAVKQAAKDAGAALSGQGPELTQGGANAPATPTGGGQPSA